MKEPALTPEVLPKETAMEKTIPHSTFPIPVSEMVHNKYHRLGKLFAASSQLCAIIVGLELKHHRKNAGHGNWEKWVEDNCEFSYDTARRYIITAESVKGKELKNGKSSFLAMLDVPPSQLPPEDQDRLVDAVRKSTDGQTLQQLYFEFGIAKAGKERPNNGGAHALKNWLLLHHPEHAGKKLADLPEEIQQEWKIWWHCHRDPIDRKLEAQHADALDQFTIIVGDLNLFVFGAVKPDLKDPRDKSPALYEALTTNELEDFSRQLFDIVQFWRSIIRDRRLAERNRR